MPRGNISRRLFLGQTLATIITLPARGEAPSPQDGFRVLEARESKLQLLPEPAALTAAWSYNGAVPGPLLRVKKGEEVKVRLVNKLSQPTTLHFHGVRIANPMDGVAGLTQEPVPPGGTFDYRFTPPDSGFYWYHPHVLPYVAEQLGRGLYGALIIDEPAPPLADRDIVAILADWKLSEKGELADFDLASDGVRAGRAGELVTLNSRPVPIEEVLPPSSRLRLRLLNACHSRLMVIRFDGVMPLILALDGQPCEPFEPTRHTIPLPPGARFDIMCDLAPEAGASANMILLGDKEPDRILLSFKTEGETRASLPPIDSLPKNTLLPAAIKLEAARRADLVLEEIAGAGAAPAGLAKDWPLHWKISGEAVQGFARPPLFSVKRGTPVTLAFINRTAFAQQMHVHGHVIRILHQLDDGWEPYWRDAILVPPAKTKRVAFVADSPGKWAVECLMAGRQATGLAAWFEVT